MQADTAEGYRLRQGLLPDHNSPLSLFRAILVPGRTRLAAATLTHGKLPELLEFIISRIMPVEVLPGNLLRKNHKSLSLVAKAPQR
jgi:hypothetical protein